ncbi:MAG: hypothetical protein SFW35_01790 [Chitinophagales bacterium]|nr:hypothetical protein [Chitinophagales bacterium]
MKLINCAILLFVSNFLFGQNALTFKETRRKQENSKPLTANGNFNIDMSSRIDITVNRDVVVSAIHKHGSPHTDTLIHDIERLTKIVEGANENIKKAQEEIAELYTSSKTSDEKALEYTNILKKLASPTGQLLKEITYPGNALYKIINDAFEASDATDALSYYIILFDETAKYVNDLKKDLEFALATEGVNIQMTATLYNSKGAVDLSLPYYNTVKNPAFYDPYAFDLALLQTELDKLSDISQTATKINEEGLGSVFNEAKEKILTIIKSRMDSILAVRLDELEKLPLQSVTLVGSAETKQFVADVSFMIREIGTLKDEIQEIVRRYKNPSGTPQAVLTGLVSDITNLTERVKGMINSAVRIQTFIKNVLPTLPSIVKNDLQVIKDWSVEVFENEVLTPLKGFLLQTGIVRASGGVANFSNEVLNHTLQSLPEHTELNFEKAGFREHGDYATLEMRAVKANSISSIEVATFNLMKTGGYVDVQAALSFVNHIEEGKFTNFVAAPSISVLYKFPTCKARYAYRKFVDFGMGINVATLNFNQENAMEIGIGLVFAGFNVHEQWRNLLTGGFGYNLIAGKPYAIVGLNLPFLGFSTK